MNTETQTFTPTRLDELNHARLRGRKAPARELALTAVALLLFGFFSLFAAYFFTLDNVLDMARVSTSILIVGIGLTFLFVAGELDLSVGANVALTTVVMGLLLTDAGQSPLLAALLALAMAAGVGAVNGFFVTLVGVPSFIVTLAMLSVLAGTSLMLTSGIPVNFPADSDSWMYSVTAGSIGQVPVVIIWGAVAFVVGAFLLRFTVFGYHVYATGGDAHAAHAAGIKTARTRFACFVLTGFLAGLVGVLQGCWLRQGDPSSGDAFTLQVIAAVILGGVALTGGAGSVYGTLVGTAIVGMLANGLVLLGVTSNATQLFVGLIIIAVASLELGLKRKTRLTRRLRTLTSRSPSPER
ncbi:MAG TPA: ABC transporter permease [Conexibacter sp.]